MARNSRVSNAYASFIKIASSIGFSGRRNVLFTKFHLDRGRKRSSLLSFPRPFSFFWCTDHRSSQHKLYIFSSSSCSYDLHYLKFHITLPLNEADAGFETAGPIRHHTSGHDASIHISYVIYRYYMYCTELFIITKDSKRFPNDNEEKEAASSYERCLVAFLVVHPHLACPDCDG